MTTPNAAQPACGAVQPAAMLILLLDGLRVRGQSRLGLAGPADRFGDLEGREESFAGREVGAVEHSSANNWRCSSMAPRPAPGSSTPTPSPPPRHRHRPDRQRHPHGRAQLAPIFGSHNTGGPAYAGSGPGHATAEPGDWLCINLIRGFVCAQLSSRYPK